jgi:hypothetical protein
MAAPLKTGTMTLRAIPDPAAIIPSSNVRKRGPAARPDNAVFLDHSAEM